eukprot:jgi/Botrbrau1/8550/Bobra.0359s0014.1
MTRVRQPVRGPYGDWASLAGPVKYLKRHSGNPHVFQRLQGLFTGRHPRLICKAIRVPRKKIGVGKGDLRGWRTALTTMILSQLLTLVERTSTTFPPTTACQSRGMMKNGTLPIQEHLRESGRPLSSRNRLKRSKSHEPFSQLCLFNRWGMGDVGILGPCRTLVMTVTGLNSRCSEQLSRMIQLRCADAVSGTPSRDHTVGINPQFRISADPLWIPELRIREIQCSLKAEGPSTFTEGPSMGPSGGKAEGPSGKPLYGSA